MTTINSEKGCYLKIRIKPGASRNLILDIRNEYIKISVKASPVENKANKELIHFLSKIFSVSKSGIKIVSGATSKTKLIKITNLNEEQAYKLLSKIKKSIHI